MRSRSARKDGLVGANGARWVVAKERAAEISGFGCVVVEDEAEVDVEVEMEVARISSISWRRSREKWREVSVSRSWGR